MKKAIALVLLIFAKPAQAVEPITLFFGSCAAAGFVAGAGVNTFTDPEVHGTIGSGMVTGVAVDLAAPAVVLPTAPGAVVSWLNPLGLGLFGCAALGGVGAAIGGATANYFSKDPTVTAPVVIDRQTYIQALDD